MRVFNLFSSPRAEEIKRRVERFEESYPELSRRELAEKIVREKSWRCALVGALTALPAIIPGIGTAFALFGGVVTDITILVYLLSGMVLEVSVLYRRELNGPAYRREALWTLILASGMGGLSSGISRAVVTQLSKEAFTGLLERTLVSLGVRATTRSSLARLLPAAGLLIAGGINYFLSKNIGMRAINYYEERYPLQEANNMAPVDVKEYHIG